MASLPAKRRLALSCFVEKVVVQREPFRVTSTARSCPVFVFPYFRFVSSPPGLGDFEEDRHRGQGQVNINPAHLVQLIQKLCIPCLFMLCIF
jgi:hypothetical protein